MAKAPRKATTAENLQSTLNNPNVRKFLDMLSQVEGTTTHGYNTTFGGGRVESLSNHPNIQREFKQTDGSTNSSGAAGRYQFLDKTWRNLQKQYPQQMPDFGERSQDFGAVALIAGRGALQDVVNGRFGTAVSKVGNIWASLPTSPYKQPKKSWDDVNKALGLQVPATGSNGSAANAQALTPEQGKRLYDIYKAGRMSPEQRADYERDFATIQKPAGATMLRSAVAPVGGSGGSGGAPVAAAAPAQAAQATAKTAPYVLPVEIIMAYNDGSMNPQQRADFERDYKAGVIAAPRHIPFELKASAVPVAERDYTGNRTQQFLDKTGEALSNAGRVIAGDGLVDAATALPRVALGGAQALVQGIGGLGVSAVSGLSGLGAGAQAALSGGNFAEAANNQIQYANRALEPLIPQPIVAPKTTGALLEAMAVPMYATEAGGQANFDAYGNPLAAAAIQGFGDAGLAALGFRGVGKAPAPRPQPTPAPVLPAATARPAPRPQAPAAPLATNPADLAAQAEAMPRPDVAPRPSATGRTELTAQNPTITIQPGAAPPRPAPVADPITDAAPTNQPIQAPAGSVTTVGEGGLNVMHGSTRADLTADQIQVVNPNSKQGKKGRVYGGFYTTPDAVVAERYANMGAEGSTPTIYDVQIKQGAQVLNKEGDITRLSESYINEQRAAGVDVIAGKDPRGQVEYAIINPEAVGALTPRAKPAAPKTAQGKAFTTSNKPVAFEYDVVPIESVVKSTNADLTPNTAARPELQPRNRDTDASTAQINKIANELNPELLAESPTFSMGAPVVLGSDAVAGHGRLAAIERRYGQGAGAEYRAFVAQKAAELGIDPARLAGVERPVLVRRVKDEADALTIAQDSNAPTTLRMSPAEQARLDAPNLPDLDKLARGADGEMNIAASYDFVRDFMSTLNDAERGDLMPVGGNITQNAVRRIQAAVSQKAYKDPDLIARFTESMGDEGKRISAALQKQAGAVAALAEAAAKGERYPTTLGADLAQAANKYADIKAAGSTVREYLDQGQLVDDGLSVGAREALEVMGENAKSGRAIGEYIQSKIAEVEAKGNPSQETLFQSSASTKKIEGLIDRLADFEKKADEDPIFGFENYEARQKILDDLVEAALSDDGFAGMAASGGLGQTVMITPSAKKAGAWQVTFFNSKMQPMSDAGIQTKQAALREFFDRFVPEKKSEETLFQTTKEQKEAEAVRKQYEGTPEWMQAPDGTPTKLSERQWVQVRTPSFKEWFGDWENNPKGASKVVDENGEPLVVYHGSPFGDFDVFTEAGAKNVSPKDAKGHYFTSDYGVAQAYGSGQYGGVRGSSATVYESYLNIKNPEMILDNNHRHWYIKQDKKDSLATGGKDGVIYRDSKDAMNDEYITFDPTQIKSATGNSGAFDSTNPNIYMQANKPQAAAIGERIAEQAKAAGRSADEAKQAGKLAEAYYAATAKALGLTPEEVFAQVGLSVERGNVGGANAALRLGEREHSMVFGDNANASSFVHEAGHHFLESHAKLADQSPKLQADVDAVMTWAGHDGRKWSDLSASQKREVHEKFAESFEQYLLTGKAPTKGLKGVFADFKAWLTDVYTSLTEFAATNPRADLSPEVMAVMDRMLGGGKTERAANAARGKNRKKSAPITPELLDFKRSAPVSGGVSPALHQSRYDVLRDIGLTDGQIRGGSVEGDLKRLEWDAELAKYDTEYGVRMKEQLELERQKLREYGDGVVESMGGTAKATPETRGAAIVRPLEAYQAWYRDKIKAFYKQADEQGAMTGGIELRGLENKLKENSAFYNDALLSMRKSLKSFMLEQRLLDSKGNPKPMSAKQAEMVRKHLNSIRTFETSRVIGELNSLIDDAVFSTLNRSVYGEARAVNTQYHRIFSDPKGIARLLDVDGINRKISHEKVAANVAALAETDAAQFRHIMAQLESMPTPELQKMGNQAIGEIRAQIAEKITAYDSTKPDTVAAIGKALAPYRGEKLREIFGEKGAQKLETFVAAHGILRKVDAQPSGTASMLRNIATKGSEVGMTGMGTAAGGAMAGPAGAAAGAVIGQQIGAKIKGAIAQAVDKKSYGKAMSPRQLETMKQSYDASGRRLAALPETEAATAAAQAAPDSARARVTNSRLERSKEWIAFYSKLTDEQKAAVKKLGAAAWLLSVGGSGDNQASDDGENR